MTPNVMICRGNIVYSKDRNELAAHSDSYIAVEDGRVEGIYERLPEKFEGTPVKDFGDNVIIPAFSDLHVHAPQFPQRGLGTIPSRRKRATRIWIMQRKYTAPS